MSACRCNNSSYIHSKISSSLNPIQSSQTVEDSQILQPTQIEQTDCRSCGLTGFFGFSTICNLGFERATDIQVSRMGVTGGEIYTITAPRGIIIDTRRVDGAIARINSQVPTGSLSGYFSSIFTNLGTSLANNAETHLGIILGSVILLTFILYVIVCIVFMANSLVSIITGITLIFIGLIFSILVFIIAFFEARQFGTNIEMDFVAQIEPTMEILRCALFSGYCCYSGTNCCCPGGATTPCTNPLAPSIQVEDGIAV